MPERCIWPLIYILFAFMHHYILIYKLNSNKTSPPNTAANAFIFRHMLPFPMCNISDVPIIDNNRLTISERSTDAMIDNVLS